MTTAELQKRSEKSQNLRVIQVDETWFYVESDEGKICYKVCFIDENQYSCTCGDFATARMCLHLNIGSFLIPLAKSPQVQEYWSSAA